MSELETLSLVTLSKIMSPSSLYLLGYGWLFGMSVWVSFFGGVIAFKALPRQQFGALQHKTFPVYFVSSIVLSSGLLSLWVFGHPTVLKNVTNPLLVDVAQAYVLASIILLQGSNYFIIGPLTSKTMFQRQRLEKEEGKQYTDENVSPAMKSLSRRFGYLHGISSLANLGCVVGLAFHGLWIGAAGL